jgi:hypothetical protein
VIEENESECAIAKQEKESGEKQDEAVHPVFYGPDETLADLKFLASNYAVSNV